MSGRLGTSTEPTVRKKPRTQIYTNKGSMATACKQRLRAGMGRASTCRCGACSHNGHAQACYTHAMNMHVHTKGFFDVDFVDVDAAGNVRASGQCRSVDMGKYSVAAVRHGTFAMEACRTTCHSVGRKSLSSRSLVSATYRVRAGRVQVAGAAWSRSL